MDINILVRPVFERQRAQSIDIPNPNINHALCVPMDIHIERIGLYAGMPNLDMLTIRKLTIMSQPTWLYSSLYP
jgi:hypothetical protein